MDAEKHVPAQDFDVPVLEVEDLMRGYDRWVNGRLVIRSVCDRGIDVRFVIRGICNREVGQSGDADGRRLNGGSYGRCRDCIWLWNSNRFGWRRLRDLEFEISVRESEGCGNGSCSGFFLIFASRLWLLSCEYWWGREALPATLP